MTVDAACLARGVSGRYDVPIRRTRTPNKTMPGRPLLDLYSQYVVHVASLSSVVSSQLLLYE